MMRVASEASCEMVEESHFRIDAWTSWACSVDATFPVPIALCHNSEFCQGREILIGLKN